MIRALTIDEVPLAADVGLSFFKEANLPGELIPSVFIASWQTLIKLKQGYIFGLFHNSFFVGGLGMIVYNDINDGALVASEAFWYVHPQHRGNGLRLLFHAQKVAKELACKRLTMIHLLNATGDKLSPLYARLGFKPIETHYLKDL
jgi:GNAT superfamily N-acetyltransferase